MAQAVEAYLADAVSRSVETSTLKKLETIFRKQFLAWTRVEGIEYLDELELDTLLNFRNTWEDGPLAKQKKQSRVIGFFWACVRRRYLTENPAIGLGKIKVVQIPTDYFPPDEFERIIAATYIRRGDRGGGDVKANQTRLRTMTLLMRWSGLRIRDAVTLEWHRLNGDILFGPAAVRSLRIRANRSIGSPDPRAVEPRSDASSCHGRIADEPLRASF